MSNEKVNFLLEIMKAKTSTRQQQTQDEPLVQPFCSDCGVSDYDTEVRDQPTGSPPGRMVYEFDYYGNPIGEQSAQEKQQLQQQLQRQLQAQLEQPAMLHLQTQQGQLQQQLQVRDRPPAPTSGWSSGYDYYGNPVPVTERDLLAQQQSQQQSQQMLQQQLRNQLHQRLQQQVQLQLHALPPPASDTTEPPKELEETHKVVTQAQNNPQQQLQPKSDGQAQKKPEPQKKSEGQKKQGDQSQKKPDGQEKPDGQPQASDDAQPQKEEENELREDKQIEARPETPLQMVNRGCVAEFSRCLSITLCCAGAGDDELALDTLASERMTHTERAEAEKKAKEEEEKAIQESAEEEKAKAAKLELELRAELAEIRRQRAEMEESYRLDIAREVSEKALLQAQLQCKLMSMMEERMLAEIQLDQVKAMAMAVSPSKKGQVPLIKSKEMTPSAMRGPLPSPDPPVHSRDPVDPSAAAPSNMAPSAAKQSPSRMSTTTPYGLSIVVENDNHHAEPGAGVSVMTPSPQAAAAKARNDPECRSPSGSRSPCPPGAPFSPPATNFICEPEGRAVDKADPRAAPSGNHSVPSDHPSLRSDEFTSLPMPVASPIEMTHKLLEMTHRIQAIE